MSREDAKVFSDLAKSVNKLIRMATRNGAKHMIKEVIYNDPATVVVWADGVKTVVRCQDGDVYDKRTGLLMCIAKRSFGNTSVYNDVLNKYAPYES